VGQYQSAANEEPIQGERAVDSQQVHGLNRSTEI
jgi:hypothetical protein